MSTVYSRDDKGIWKRALWTVPLLVGVGSLMGVVSNSGYDNGWFASLLKPSFMPPGWAFGAAWTALYTMLGIALATVLNEPPSKLRSRGLALFGVQLLLNFAWSPVFFRGHDMQLALVMLVAMIVLTIGTIKSFWAVRPLAGALMLPYLGWLMFATLLNSATLNLNPGANVSLLGL